MSNDDNHTETPVERPDIANIFIGATVNNIFDNLFVNLQKLLFYAWSDFRKIKRWSHNCHKFVITSS